MKPFEEAGVQGAATVAVAAAMVGIVMGGVIGAPISTRLIERHRLATRHAPQPVELVPATEVVEEQLGRRADPRARGRGRRELRAAAERGADPAGHVAGRVPERLVHLHRHQAPRLHRGHAGGGRHPQPGRRYGGCSAYSSG